MDLFDTEAIAVKIEAPGAPSERQSVKKGRAQDKQRNSGVSIGGGVADLRRTPSGPGADLLATKEAARRLGIGVSTLEKMRLQRRGPPFIRFGRNIVRYRLEDLDAWVLTLTRR